MLGCAAVKSNGAVVARAGSALVAAAAAAERKPVLICAQTAKFHDDVQLDAITSNEQADPAVRCRICSHVLLLVLQTPCFETWMPGLPKSNMSQRFSSQVA